MLSLGELGGDDHEAQVDHEERAHLVGEVQKSQSDQTAAMQLCNDVGTVIPQTYSIKVQLYVCEIFHLAVKLENQHYGYINILFKEELTADFIPPQGVKRVIKHCFNKKPIHY